MGAFDSELYNLGYRFSYKRKEKDLTEVCEPLTIGNIYLIYIGTKLTKVKLISVHNELGIVERLEPVQSEWSCSPLKEECFRIRTTTFYKV